MEDKILNNSSFWKGLFLENNPVSSRRLITLVVSAVFVLTCLTTVILLMFIFTGEARLQTMNIEALKNLTELLTQIVYYEFMIVIGGLAFITAPTFAKVLVSSLSSMFMKGTPQQVDPWGNTMIQPPPEIEEDTAIPQFTPEPELKEIKNEPKRRTKASR